MCNEEKYYLDSSERVEKLKKEILNLQNQLGIALNEQAIALNYLNKKRGIN
jgi:hypothetical protein